MRGFRIYTQKESKNLQIKEVSDAEKEVYLHKAGVTKKSTAKGDQVQTVCMKDWVFGRSNSVISAVYVN